MLREEWPVSGDPRRLARAGWTGQGKIVAFRRCRRSGLLLDQPYERPFGALLASPPRRPVVRLGMPPRWNENNSFGDSTCRHLDFKRERGRSIQMIEQRPRISATGSGRCTVQWALAATKSQKVPGAKYQSLKITGSDGPASSRLSQSDATEGQRALHHQFNANPRQHTRTAGREHVWRAPPVPALKGTRGGRNGPLALPSRNQ